ncbi:hypothetical protein PV05_08622 [Exophiala xenobiotica]|uniref:Uncharacterized protein n=1 Tax=Exophiala xenobiotica TaxID=348802 RepID=A0A0D2CSQ4_9EURO|nr:uncharacterized protein PV05_08622 [Exophiala xenobiotica]KIW53017.1 hypothetical protein PV05_08622 [Exophiala xenobiotica]
MGLNGHYRSVSANDESFPLAPPDKEGHKRSGWGKQSILLSLATGTLFIAVIAAVLSTVGSAVVSYKSSGTSDAASTATNTAAASTATSALLEDVSKAQEAEIQDCGGNPEEARAKGCVFDVMMQDWMPADCYDEGLSERFLAEGNWTWYADTSAENTYTLDEMRKGEHGAVYVAQEYHITHCIYAWETLVRAMRNQRPLITELISYDHVIHCRHKTLQRADGGSAIRGVRAPVAYTKCAPYDVWKNHLPENSHSTTD